MSASSCDSPSESRCSVNASDQVVIQEQYAHSDSRARHPDDSRFRTATEIAANVQEMAEKSSPEPEPVSEFIRLHIERWERDGKLIKDLATAAGLAKSMPSQIKARTSNATLYSARKLAGPLGYRD